MPSPEPCAVLFHTDRFPPLLVSLDTLAVSGEGLPDETAVLPAEEARELLYARGYAEGDNAVVLRDGTGAPVLRFRIQLAVSMGTNASVMVEEPERGLWRRYRPAPLDPEAIVLLTLATGWATYGRVTVEPSLDAGHLSARPALPLPKLHAILDALEAKGQVVHAPNRHGVSKWIYLPEAPACHLPKVERAAAPWKHHLAAEEVRGLDAALRAYVGVMGENYDPNRRVTKLSIDTIAVRVYGQVAGKGRSSADAFVAQALEDLKRELAADLPPGAFSPPRY